jgi:hypothetical protein
LCWLLQTQRVGCKSFIQEQGSAAAQHAAAENGSAFIDVLAISAGRRRASNHAAKKKDEEQ